MPSGLTNTHAGRMQQGFAKGDVVGLLMNNRPEYFAIWLGITSIGGVVALLNTNLAGASLAHCINIVSPKTLIVSAELRLSLASAQPHLDAAPTLWMHGIDQEPHRRIDLVLNHISGTTLTCAERPQVDHRRSCTVHLHVGNDRAAQSR